MDTLKAPEKMALTSMSITEEQRAKLKSIFPEVFTEGNKIDFDKLKLTLGEMVDTGKERYGMTWPGKAECFQTIQKPSMATLLPVREESVNFDETENLIIEGDNLEVLKLLQKAYLGKIKIVYIDPPYNTGNDFIYPDNYSESLETYLQYTGQVDLEGRKYSTNTEADGRFHSKWLNMMYPRIFLSRNLLKEDGVFFASISDKEVANFRKLMDEIFGEENFIACLVWEKGRKNDAKFFSLGHEYMLVYAKDQSLLREQGIVWREEKPGAKEIWQKYLELKGLHGMNYKRMEDQLQAWYSSLPDKHPSKKLSRYKHIDKNGPWRDDNISWPGGGGPTYDVIHPITGKPCKVPERGWVFAELETMQGQINAGLIEFREDHTEPPIRKSYIRPLAAEISTEEDGDESGNQEDDAVATHVRGSYFYKQSQVAVKYLRKLLGPKVFANPKDHEELAKIFRYVSNGGNDDLVLDFFAGSGSTADAVLTLNAQDSSHRKFILVQLPEPLNLDNKEQKAAAQFCSQNNLRANIAEVTKERVRRSIKQLEAEHAARLQFDSTSKQDFGFKVFKLADSNFSTWKPEVVKDTNALREQLELHVNHLRPGRFPEDLLFELLLKTGFVLTTRVETLELASKGVYKIAGGDMFVCLARELSPEVIKAMANMRPPRVVCLDAGFAGNDQLKSNAVQIMKSKGVTSFKTV